MATQKHFDWHDYIAIGTSDKALLRSARHFTREERHLIEQSLSTIASAFDHEGEELIRAAFIANNGVKLRIIPTHTGNSFATRVQPFTIRMDVAATGTLGFVQPGDLPARSPSVTGFLVHELFHLADPGMDPEVVRAATEAALRPLLKDTGISPIRASNKLKRSLTARAIFYHAPADENERAVAITKLRNIHATALANMLEQVPAQSIRDALVAAGITNAQGTAIVEVRATEYANHFMNKNVGDLEPQRIDYDAVTNIIAPTAPHSLSRDAQPHPDNGYNAGNGSPIIRAIQESPSNSAAMDNFRQCVSGTKTTCPIGAESFTLSPLRFGQTPAATSSPMPRK